MINKINKDNDLKRKILVNLIVKYKKDETNKVMQNSAIIPHKNIHCS